MDAEYADADKLHARDGRCDGDRSTVAESGPLVVSLSDCLAHIISEDQAGGELLVIGSGASAF